MTNYCNNCGEILQEGETCGCIPNTSDQSEGRVGPSKQPIQQSVQFNSTTNLNKKKKWPVIIGVIGAAFVILGVLVAIIDEISPSNGIKAILEPSNNVNGIRFNLTLPEYIEHYNNVLTATEDNSATIGWNTLSIDDFSVLADGQDFDQETDVYIKRYGYTNNDMKGETRYIITLDIEEDTGKIVMLQFVFSNQYYNSLTEIGQVNLLTKEMPRSIVALDNEENIDTVKSNISNMFEQTPNIFYDSGVVYNCKTDSYNNTIYSIQAMSEEKYDKIMNNR